MMPLAHTNQAMLYPCLSLALGGLPDEPPCEVTLNALEAVARNLAGKGEAAAIGSLLAGYRERWSANTGNPLDPHLLEAFINAIQSKYPDLAFAVIALGVPSLMTAEAIADRSHTDRPDPSVIEVVLLACEASNDDLSEIELRLMAFCRKEIERLIGEDEENGYHFLALLGILAGKKFSSVSNGKPLLRLLNHLSSEIKRADLLGCDPIELRRSRGDFIDPCFRVYASQAARQNLLAPSLQETIDMCCDLLRKSQRKLWPYSAFDDFESFELHQPEAVAGFVLDTLHAPASQLLKSFSKEQIGTGLVAAGHDEQMLLTTRIVELNTLLEGVAHDRGKRLEAYTSLLACISSLRANKYLVVMGGMERFDELLEVVAPWASMKGALAQLDDRAALPLQKFITRHHLELIDLVPLAARGQGYAESLGL